MYAASLDASKAFDKINQYGLLIRLMERKVPAPFLNVQINWHLKWNGVVRWGGGLSHVIKFMSGIRQEGILSGLCFNIYVSHLINKLRDNSSGCRLINVFFRINSVCW